MTRADRTIAAIATGQLGAFTRTQAHDAGLSDRQLRSRVQSGSLVKTGPNAFRFTGAPLTLESELRSLVLDIGDPVWVCGPTAAALHGMEGYALRKPFHILVPHHRHLTRKEVVLHQSEHMALIDRAEVDLIIVTSGARTVIDLARLAGSDQLLEAVDNVLLLGLANEDLLYRRIGALRSKGRFGVPALLDVLDQRRLASGSESWLEREYLRLLRSAAVPTPATQQVLSHTHDHLVRVDCRFPGTNLVVELLGYRYHRSRRDMNRDASRLNALIADGFTPYQFTFDDVVGDGQRVVVETRSALN